MGKFKVGDRVIDTIDGNGVGTVVKVLGLYTIDVKFDISGRILRAIEKQLQLLDTESSGQALGNAIRNLIDSGSVVSMKKVSISTDEYEVVITKTEK